MQDFSASPREMVASFWRNRQLIKALVQRDVIGRYKGSYLGILWSFFNPILMLAVYTFVFSVVFKARWSGISETKTEFALILFVGLIVFNLFSECITKAPNLIISNVNYVKKVIFPLEILPVVSLGSGLFHMIISLIVCSLFHLLFFGPMPWSVLLLPLVLLPLIFFILGLSWCLASLGVYFRDISQVVMVSVPALMFLSPVFYSINSLPKWLQPILALNPVAPSIEFIRQIFIWGETPSWYFFSIYFFCTLIFSFISFMWFQLTRKGFADVL